MNTEHSPVRQQVLSMWGQADLSPSKENSQGCLHAMSSSLGLCNQTLRMQEISAASAADVWRSIRDNGSVWTWRSPGQAFSWL